MGSNLHKPNNGIKNTNEIIIIKNKKMRTEQILPAEVQGLVDTILSQDLILAEVELDTIIIDGVEHKQYLRVKDVNIALSIEYLKVCSKRILVNQVTGEEKDLNLSVPDWTKTGQDMMALVNENGERMYFETNYYDDVLIQEGYYDEELEQYIPPVYEEQLIETKQEVKLVPTLKTLMFIIGTKAFKTVFEMFTLQYVSDIKVGNPNFFKELK